jgi:tRNA(Ile)-lysidine synthase
MSRRGPQPEPAGVYSQLLKLYPRAATAPLCVAFSGGEDSTALLGMLAQLPQLRARLRAIHIDHGLHPDSESWARICRRSCRTLRVPFATRRLRLTRRRGQSLEAFARDARYAALAAALRPGEVLLTAHHLDDQLETVLLQLLRGAGLPGLAAMPAVMPLGPGVLVRPLLGLSRDALRAWLVGRNLTCVSDPSNLTDAFDRNYLRHKVLPSILSRWPGAAQTLARAARHAAEAQQLLDDLARADVARAADGAALSVAALRALPLARRRNALRFWIGRSEAAAGQGLPDARRLEEIAVTLLAARAGANPFVEWGSMRVQRHAGRLLLGPVPAAAAAYELTWDLRRVARLELPQAGHLELVRSAHGRIDAALLPARLTVRTRRGGERLRPRPGGPSRALKGLLQNERISLIERQRLPLLFAGDALVAVADLWVDARWQPGAASRDRMTVVWHRPA